MLIFFSDVVALRWMVLDGSFSVRVSAVLSVFAESWFSAIAAVVRSRDSCFSTVRLR